MRLFLDTGSVEEARRAAGWGVVEGATTNPSLVAGSGRSREDLAREICGVIDGPVSVEVVSTDREGMVREARDLHGLHPNVVVKLPLTEAGIAACKWCAGEGIRTNVTLCFSAAQALLAARAGADFVSPFIGRIDDTGHDGLDLIEDMRTIYDNYGFKTAVLAASVRNQGHVREAALAGADAATMPIGVLAGLFAHPLTEAGLARFLADHRRANP